MWLFSEVKTLGDIPRHYAKQTPDAPALVDAVRTISFADFDERTNRIANALIAMDVRPSDRVSFIGKNSNRCFEVFFGCAKAGASFAPLNWRLTVPELTGIVTDAGPRVLFVDREYEETADRVLRNVNLEIRKVTFDSAKSSGTELDRLMAESPASDPQIKIDAESTALLLYTSGTTGEPKGVQLSHQGFSYVRLCEHFEPDMQYVPGDALLTVMPLFHAMAYYFSLQALYNGAATINYPMPDPAGLKQLIRERRPTIVPLVPTALYLLLSLRDAETADFSSIRVLIYAGSPIDPHLLAQAMRVLSSKFMQLYGSTETGGAAVVLLRPQDHQLDDPQSRLKSCGTPFPLVDVKIVDPEGNEVPDGTVGEFLIRSPFLATGYFNKPELSAATFKDGWYRSGDGGYRDKDGFLYLVDRIKDMIVTGGSNVYSVEVENAIGRLQAVQRCAVVGLPDPKWGERVVAVIVKAPSAELSADEVIAHCRTLIAGYKVPKQVEFMSVLPITPTGKVKKAELRSQLLNAK